MALRNRVHVWVATEWYDYEGGSVEGVFTTPEAAKAFLDKKLNKEGCAMEWKMDGRTHYEKRVRCQTYAVDRYEVKS